MERMLRLLCVYVSERVRRRRRWGGGGGGGGGGEGRGNIGSYNLTGHGISYSLT